MAEACVLCAARNETYRLVYADDLTMVVVNLEPVKDGHLMILPIRHAQNLGELTPEEAIRFLQVIDRTLAALTKAYPEAPMCLVNGWQHRTQPHLHAHVVPSQKDMRGLYAAAEGTPERQRASQETLTRIASEVRAVFT